MRRHYSFDPTVEIVSYRAEDQQGVEAIDLAKEAYRDEDKTLAYTALGLLGLAITIGGAAAARHHIKKHKE
ncbi:MAG TPA: hypothetical protein VGE13_02015 [Candidatus Saccharimonadales bacterium]